MDQQKILNVTADGYYSQAVERILEDTGYRVIGAVRGTLALDILQHERIDLVILDWELPDCSGLSVTRRIREDFNIMHLPIVVTGRRMDETDKIITLEAGADLCLSESFHPKVFVARLRALLRRNQLLSGTL
jgi:two-component system alkaline phosphatase synthesis response regulator PhoP